MIYLDSAATSLLKPFGVKEAMLNALDNMASPGRGSHKAALSAANAVYECREKICSLFNYNKPQNVVFTYNATHALNIAIRSLVKAGDRVCISGYEHNSVTRVLEAVGAKVSVAESELFDTTGTIKAFEKLIANSDVVICNHVSNVFGFVLPVYEIAEMCKERSVPFILDASQSAGILNIDLTHLPCAFVCMPGHKGLMGPQGTGVMICNAVPKPLLYGGTGSDSLIQTMPDFLPDSLEAGTHNVCGIAGLSAGIDYILSVGTDSIAGHEKKLLETAVKGLKEIPELEVFASDCDNQAGVLSLRHKTIPAEALCEALGEMGVAARCGLHCAPLAHKSARTLDTGTLRLSFSPFVSEAELIQAVKILKNIIIYEKIAIK